MLAAQFHSRARSGHLARCRARSGHRWSCRATFRHRRASERTKAARQRLRCPKVARWHRRNVASVRISPGNAVRHPAHVQKPPENADGMLGKCPKAARQCGAGAGVRFSPDATTTAPAPAVSRCAAVVLLRACRESALIPRGYERAHTGRSHRHRARGR